MWRFEFQLRREALREFKIHTPGDLKDRVASVWRYLTTDWFSLREHDSGHTTRRTCCPLWHDVQQVADRFPGALEASRAGEPGMADLTRIIQQVLGYSKTYAARQRITNVSEALRALLEDVYEATTPEDFAEAVRKRAIRAGIHMGEAGEDAA